MKRKKILALLMAAAMVVGLAACSGGGDADKGGDDAQTTDDGGEQTTLRIAWWGSQARHDATVEALNLYEESHPDMKGSRMRMDRQCCLYWSIYRECMGSMWREKKFSGEALEKRRQSLSRYGAEVFTES